MQDRFSNPIKDIHGFQVLCAAPVSSEFKRALKYLSSLGYADSSVVIIKTKRGWKFGDPPVDGKYVLPSNPYSQAVITSLKERGIEPPSMPFIFTPGATTLFHEWGHHVDLTWSGEDDILTFSTKWFSHFFEIDMTNLLSKQDAEALVIQWHPFASELFANLFDDWMRGDKKLDGDCLDPLRKWIVLLDGISPRDIRVKTYALFTKGLSGQVGLPDMRPHIFGLQTEAALRSYRKTVIQLREKNPDS